MRIPIGWSVAFLGAALGCSCSVSRLTPDGGTPPATDGGTFDGGTRRDGGFADGGTGRPLQEPGTTAMPLPPAPTPQTPTTQAQGPLPRTPVRPAGGARPSN